MQISAVRFSGIVGIDCVILIIGMYCLFSLVFHWPLILGVVYYGCRYRYRYR